MEARACAKDAPATQAAGARDGEDGAEDRADAKEHQEDAKGSTPFL